MVKIRLMRMGSKRNPHYRLVVIDGRSKRSGRYIEQIGYYDPRQTTEENLRIDTERATYWLSSGAQPTDTALRLLERSGVEVPENLAAMRRDNYVKRKAAETPNA